jgi:mannose/fructose/N-acetylgalactosamine-specific phosphotransferase system component IID
VLKIFVFDDEVKRRRVVLFMTAAEFLVWTLHGQAEFERHISLGFLFRIKPQIRRSSKSDMALR